MAAKKISIQYFALLREERGLSSEELETQARDARELYRDLKSVHGFSLDCERLKVAVNDQFQDWTYQLQANDRIVFVPPVAGG